MASSPWGAVRPTPESGLLAKQVSTAQARSAGGQRHFRPPGARHYALAAMRVLAGPGQLNFRTVYDVYLFRTNSVLNQNNGSRVEFLLLANADPVCFNNLVRLTAGLSRGVCSSP